MIPRSRCYFVRTKMMNWVKFMQLLDHIFSLEHPKAKWNVLRGKTWWRQWWRHRCLISLPMCNCKQKGFRGEVVSKLCCNTSNNCFSHWANSNVKYGLQGLTLSFLGKKFLGSKLLADVLLCRACMVSVCLCGLFPGVPVSSHSPKTFMSG